MTPGAAGRGRTLGELEQLVLLAVLNLGDEAYGVRVHEEIREVGGREVSITAIYGALDRLASKGLVSSRLGEPSPERGGRAKKFFRVEPDGREALEASLTAIARLWGSAPRDMRRESA